MPRFMSQSRGRHICSITNHQEVAIYGKERVAVEVGLLPVGSRRRSAPSSVFSNSRGNARCSIPRWGRAQRCVRLPPDTQARRYGIELDSFRAMEAGRVLDEVVQGSVFDTYCAVESYSLLYRNPPYDDEIAEGRQPEDGAGVSGALLSLAAARRGSSC